MSLSEFMDTHFMTMWWLCFGWVLVAFTFKYFWHHSKGRFISDPPRDQVVYHESFASGRSLKSVFTRLGSASNCLKVTVTPDRLLVRPFFPFSILGPDLDLIHSIPILSIDRVKRVEGIMSRRLEITFRLPSGESRAIELMSKRPDEFRRTLDAAIEVKKALQTTSVTRSGFGKVSVSDRQRRGV